MGAGHTLTTGSFLQTPFQEYKTDTLTISNWSSLFSFNTFYWGSSDILVGYFMIYKFRICIVFLAPPLSCALFPRSRKQYLPLRGRGRRQRGGVIKMTDQSKSRIYPQNFRKNLYWKQRSPSGYHIFWVSDPASFHENTWMSLRSWGCIPP